MEKKDLQETARKVFEAHDLEEIYVTADGQAFTEEHYAENHANSLKSKDVVKYQREDFEEQTALSEGGEVLQRTLTPKTAQTTTEEKGEGNKEDAPSGDAGSEIDPTQDAPFDYEGIHRELLEDRAFLVARYEALEGKKPAHNIGTEKLAEKVQEIENERFKK